MIPDLWQPETVYLNTASFGLPPDPAFEALSAAQEDWRHGRVSWEHWTAVTDRARAEFGTLVKMRPENITVGANVSGLIAQIAAAVPDGANVLAPEPEFTSLLFPFLAQADRGVTVTVVPLADIAERVDADTDVIAVSAVQSSTGELADLDAITEAAVQHGALTVIDAALNQVNSGRADLGAIQNRFSSTISNLQTTSDNVTASRSRITDADFASETANLSRAQVLQQAATAMVAQANQLPQQVLQLLR